MILKHKLKVKDKFIAIRLDDYHDRCNIEQWDYLINKITERNIPCHVGLIAFNLDPEIVYRKTSFDIWSKARSWQNKGVHFWIHGYSHELEKGFCNLKLSNIGEFYKDKFDQINSKINEVIKIFYLNGIEPLGFFAPAHGYSSSLIEVLKNNPKIKMVWDGYWPSPKIVFGLKFLPLQFWKIYPRFMRPSFSGVCLHPSSMKKEDIDLFFIKLDRERKKDLKINFKNLIFKKISFNDRLFDLIYRVIFLLKKFF